MQHHIYHIFSYRTRVLFLRMRSGAQLRLLHNPIRQSPIDIPSECLAALGLTESFQSDLQQLITSISLESGQSPTGGRRSCRILGICCRCQTCWSHKLIEFQGLAQPNQGNVVVSRRSFVIGMRYYAIDVELA